MYSTVERGGRTPVDTELLNHVEARGGKFDATSSPLFCFSILTARHRAASRSPGRGGSPWLSVTEQPAQCV